MPLCRQDMTPPPQSPPPYPRHPLIHLHPYLSALLSAPSLTSPRTSFALSFAVFFFFFPPISPHLILFFFFHFHVSPHMCHRLNLTHLVLNAPPPHPTYLHSHIDFQISYRLTAIIDFFFSLFSDFSQNRVLKKISQFTEPDIPQTVVMLPRKPKQEQVMVGGD